MPGTVAALHRYPVKSLQGEPLALVAGLLYWCVLIFKPFLVPVLWALVIAAALAGIFGRLVGLTGSRGRAGVLFALLGIVLVLGPSYVLSKSLVGSVADMRDKLEAGTLDVPPPPEGLGNVPGIGPRFEQIWQQADANVQSVIEQFEPQIRAALGWFVGFLAGVGGQRQTGGQ